MKSTQERLLEDGNTVCIEFTMDRFTWDIFKPKAGHTFMTEYGFKAAVVDITYYEESRFGIVRIKRV